VSDLEQFGTEQFRVPVDVLVDDLNS